MITALIVGLLLGLGQTHESQSIPLDTRRDVTSFLFAVYPDLRNYALDVSLQPREVGFELILRDVTGRTTPADIMAAPRLLQGVVSLDRNYRVQSFTGQGRFLRGADNLALTRAIQDATREQRPAGDEVARVNPHFGPGKGAELLATVSGVIEKRFGPFTVQSADSQLSGVGNYAFAWIVMITTTADDGSPAKYALTFEPFEGLLISFVERR